MISRIFALFLRIFEHRRYLHIVCVSLRVNIDLFHFSEARILGAKIIRQPRKEKDCKPHIKRPMNAFMIWAKNQRKDLIAKGMDGASVSKLLAEKWKSLPVEEQHEYFNEAERLKNLHQARHPCPAYISGLLNTSG